MTTSNTPTLSRRAARAGGADLPRRAARAGSADLPRGTARGDDTGLPRGATHIRSAARLRGAARASGAARVRRDRRSSVLLAPPRRLLFWVRRLAAAVLLALAAGLAVYALAPPPPEMHDAAMLRAPAPAGKPITADMIEVRPVPVVALPPDHFASADAVVGSVARIGLPEGTVLSAPVVLGQSVVDDAPPGYAVLAVELARPADALLAEPGRTVTLVGRDPHTGESRGLADVLVLGVASPDGLSLAVASATTTAETTIAYVAVPDGDAIVLGDALAAAPVSVLLSP